MEESFANQEPSNPDYFQRGYQRDSHQSCPEVSDYRMCRRCSSFSLSDAFVYIYLVVKCFILLLIMFWNFKLYIYLYLVAYM